MLGSQGPLPRAALTTVALQIPLCPGSATGQEGDGLGGPLASIPLTVRPLSRHVAAGFSGLESGEATVCTAGLACLNLSPG